jgi:RNA ligase (TIGR02306 family)
VPNNDYFKWYTGGKDTIRHRKVSARKLRGVWSQGLLIPAENHFEIGQDVASILGIEPYETDAGATTRIPQSKMPGKPGRSVEGPANIVAPKYDVDSFLRYARRMFIPGEEIIVTEKMHGSSSKFVYVDGEYHCGSRNEWKSYSDSCPWWSTLNKYDGLRRFLKDNPGMVVYGEIFGWNREHTYGCKEGAINFAAFDILDNGKWIDYHTARELAYDVPWVPVIYKAYYEESFIKTLADGDSVYPGASNKREGIVIKPLVERYFGNSRVHLKLVSNDFLEKC